MVDLLYLAGKCRGVQLLEFSSRTKFYKVPTNLHREQSSTRIYQRRYLRIALDIVASVKRTHLSASWLGNVGW